jgi:hypothetical protein
MTKVVEYASAWSQLSGVSMVKVVAIHTKADLSALYIQRRASAIVAITSWRFRPTPHLIVSKEAPVRAVFIVRINFAWEKNHISITIAAPRENFLCDEAQNGFQGKGKKCPEAKGWLVNGSCRNGFRLSTICLLGLIDHWLLIIRTASDLNILWRQRLLTEIWFDRVGEIEWME